MKIYGWALSLFTQFDDVTKNLTEHALHIANRKIHPTVRFRVFVYSEFIRDIALHQLSESSCPSLLSRRPSDGQSLLPFCFVNLFIHSVSKTSLQSSPSKVCVYSVQRMSLQLRTEIFLCKLYLLHNPNSS